MSKTSSLSHFAAHLRTQFDTFKLKRQAANPKAHPGADAKLRLHYAKQGKITEALYLRAGGLYASRNPPSFGDEAKASSHYRKMVNEVARQFRRRGREDAAQGAQQLGEAVRRKPSDVSAASAYGRELRQLNANLYRASVDE